MTPARFRTLANLIAGPHWRTKLGPMVGRCRTQVWEYANGERQVQEPVAKLMELLAKDRP